MKTKTAFKSARILLQAQKLEVFIYLILKRSNEAKGLANIHYILCRALKKCAIIFRFFPSGAVHKLNRLVFFNE